MVLTTAKESMDIHRAYFGGMAQAMEKSIRSLGGGTSHWVAPSSL